MPPWRKEHSTRRALGAGPAGEVRLEATPPPRREAKTRWLSPFTGIRTPVLNARTRVMLNASRSSSAVQGWAAPAKCCAGLSRRELVTLTRKK